MNPIPEKAEDELEEIAKQLPVKEIEVVGQVRFQEEAQSARANPKPFINDE